MFVFAKLRCFSASNQYFLLRLFPDVIKVARCEIIIIMQFRKSDINLHPDSDNEQSSSKSKEQDVAEHL